MYLKATENWSRNGVELFLLKPEDVSQNYVAWLNDVEVNRFLESRFLKHTLESTSSFVECCINSSNSLLLGIRYRSPEVRHIGNVKIDIDWNHLRGEIGILIGDKTMFGKGIATKTIEAMVEIARSELKLRIVTAGCYLKNIGSKKAFLKAGFNVDFVRKSYFLLDGGSEDLVLMSRKL